MFKMLIILITLSFSSPLVKADTELPEPHVMPGMTTSWVGKDLKVNGLPMRIAEFRTDKPPIAVLDYYQDRWYGTTPPEIPPADGLGMRHIGKTLGSHHHSVQLAGTEFGTSGRLVVSSVPDETVERSTTSLPLPAALTVTSRIESNDNGTLAETLIGESTMGFDNVLPSVRTSLGVRGWIFTHQYDGADELSRIYRFDHRNGDVCQMNVSLVDGQEIWMIHWIRNG
jgi:hypothetical protein